MAAVVGVGAPAAAVTPRDTLVAAAFSVQDKGQAIRQVDRALLLSEQLLATNPHNREANFQQAMAIGYRAKLKRNAGDAKDARRRFEALAASDPRDPETQVAIGGWHLDAIAELGSLIAGAALGAKKAAGVAALDRAVALGGNRAGFPAIAALMRIRLDPRDIARSRALAEAATRSAAPTPLDRILQRSAAALLVPLRTGDGKGAAALARQLLPFGRLKG